jgi:hypothetical protein
MKYMHLMCTKTEELCFLYRVYCAFYHKLNINKQMHKIIDTYQIYFRPLHMFQQTSCLLQGVLNRELQELFTSKYTVLLHIKHFYRTYICHGRDSQV